MGMRLNSSISPELRDYLVNTYGESTLANIAIGKLASVAFDILRAAGHDIGFEALLKLEKLDLAAGKKAASTLREQTDGEDPMDLINEFMEVDD